MKKSDEQNQSATEEEGKELTRIGSIRLWIRSLQLIELVLKDLTLTVDNSQEIESNFGCRESGKYFASDSEEKYFSLFP